MAVSSSSPVVFPVRRRQPQLIVPEKPTTHELKPLSDIDDQDGLRFQIGFVMFYRSHPLMKGKDPVEIIRAALSKALVFYYPFAGRVVEGPNRKLMVDCNEEGILFVEADAQVTMDQLGDTIQPPSPYIEELLHDVPGSASIVGCPLLLIQITRLACGGFVFGVRINHTLSDSLGLVKFLSMVGEFARGATTPSLLPVWERQILNARNPPRITCKHLEYDEPSHINTTKHVQLDSYHNNMVQSSFFFGPNELNSIRNHLPPHLRQSSKFETITACIWRCRTIALELDPDDVVSLSAMIGLPGKDFLKVPPGFYGNAFAFPTVLSKAQLLCKNPLGYALDLVKQVKGKMDGEYIKSVADLMVIRGRPQYSYTPWNFHVADTTRVGFADIDFGWGKPCYGGPIGTPIHNISVCAPYKSTKGEEGVVVPISLPSWAMKNFRRELLNLTRLPMQDSPFDTITYPQFISML